MFVRAAGERSERIPLRRSSAENLLYLAEVMATVWILIVAALTAIFAVALAKSGRKRKFRNYLRGEVDEQFALGTLAANTVITDVVDDTLREKAWLSSVVLTWALDNFTPATTDGPIMVGVAHSDYSTAEIEEWIENAASWHQGDMVAQEIGKRRIRKVGMFRSDAAVTATGAYVLNDGKPIKTKCGWQLITAQTLRFWAYNTGESALATTDPNVHLQGHANLWPN